MTQLEDEFVLMLLFTGQKQGLIEQITKECRRLEKEKNISAFVRELEPEITKPKKSFTTHSLHVEGEDQAGMVYKISDILRGQVFKKIIQDNQFVLHCVFQHHKPFFPVFFHFFPV